MAAALALAFQSSHLQDGMAEFLTMVRGCNLIAGDQALTHPDSAFHVSSTTSIHYLEHSKLTTPKAFREDGHLQTMRTRIATSSLNCMNHSDLDLAALSLHALDDLAMTPCEATYWSILVRTVDAAYTDPVETYTTFVLLYNLPSKWTHDEFQAFIDPGNAVAQILLAHFIAVQAILTPILYLERVGFQGVDAPTCVLSWIEGIYGNVPVGLRGYVEWPRQVAGYSFVRFLGQRPVEMGLDMEYFDEDALGLLV